MRCFYHMIYLYNSYGGNPLPLAVHDIAHDQSAHPIVEANKIAAITKAIVRAADAWKLTNQETADLFDMPIATWNRMNVGAY